jgi:hypothetical protein
MIATTRFTVDLADYIDRATPHLDDEALTLTLESLPATATREEFARSYLGHRAFALGCAHGDSRDAAGAWRRIAGAWELLNEDAIGLRVTVDVLNDNDLLGAFSDGYNTNLRGGELPVRFR